jgi:xanthine/uracil permease
MTNRRVGVYVAAVFALLAVMPGAALLISSVPRDGVVAAFIFTGAFVLTSGVKMMSERGMDHDMALMLGLALLARFAVELCLAIRIVCSAVLLPLLSSPIVGRTLAAAAILILQRVSASRRVSAASGPRVKKYFHALLPYTGDGTKRD